MAKNKKTNIGRDAWLQCRISPDERRDLKQIASSINEPVSRIVRAAVKEKLYTIRQQIDAGELVTL
jgi:predicted transcriptional regulator